MTDVPDGVREDVPAPAEVAEPDGGAKPDGGAERPAEDGIAPAEPTRYPVGPPPARRGMPRDRLIALFAGATALVAVLCGMLLPFAPVSVNEPTVSWPQDPDRPVSTLLSLTAYRPLAMDIRFTCAAARVAQENGGVLVSTAAPSSPVAGTTGLIVTIRDDRVQVGGLDRMLLDEPLPVGPCEYRISGQSRGTPSFVRPDVAPGVDPPDLSAFARPDNAELTISRGSTLLVSTPAEQLPDVDVLATDVPGLSDGGLSVQLRVDDEFTSSPTAVKSMLTWLLVLALVATPVLLARLDRLRARVPHVRRFALPRIVDVLVPAVILFWMFVAPATDDDGYYAAMARNSVITGGVGNYYQLYDQNFTPFTWFYQALGWWQQLAGNAPVQQRIPAAVFGIVTWFALRRLAVIAMREWAPDRRGVRVLAHAVLAVVFLSWWVPFDMGVRPETVVAMCGALTMLAVLVAGRRSRLALAWLAFALAGLGFTAHPTGFTLFAPLIAGLPLLWPVVRVVGDWKGTALRALAVASGGMLAPLLAFADGALRDFIRGQTIFLSLQGQEGWSTEIERYDFLLSQMAMGNYAKRAAVLACLVALGWFAVLAVAARMRRIALPTPLWLAGSTTALAFASLWFTPSKWSHHFGALAGVGPLFLALLLVTGVPLTRKVLQGSRLPYGVLAAAGASFVLVTALAWHGPNMWPYASLAGMHRPDLPPRVRGILLDSIPLWAVVMVLTALVLVGVARALARTDLRAAALCAVPVVVVVSLLGSTGYTVVNFGQGAARGTPAESVWAHGLHDPGGSDCGAASTVRVLDPATSTTLPLAPDQPAQQAPVGFERGEGYYHGNEPQGPLGSQVWGSLLPVPTGGPEHNVGQMATGWYTLPQGLAGGDAVAVIAAGTLEDGNTLTAVYGQRTETGTVIVMDGDDQALTDEARYPSWRTFTLEPPPGADVVRLSAVDATGGLHGWLAFSPPVVQRAVPLSQYLPAGAPVAMAWQLAFGYPCQRQPTIVDGITEAPRYAVQYGDGGLGGLGDGTWLPFRGGAYAQVPRTQSVQQLAVVPGVDPSIQVYAFGTGFAAGAYTVTETRRTVSGGSVDTGARPPAEG